VTALYNHMLGDEPHLYFMLLGKRRRGEACHRPKSGIGRDELSEAEIICHLNCGTSGLYFFRKDWWHR